MSPVILDHGGPGSIASGYPAQRTHKRESEQVFCAALKLAAFSDPGFIEQRRGLSLNLRDSLSVTYHFVCHPTRFNHGT